MKYNNYFKINYGETDNNNKFIPYNEETVASTTQKIGKNGKLVDNTLVGKNLFESSNSLNLDTRIKK